jgi:hypothetical protein
MVSEDVTPQVAREADEVDVESKPAANKLKKQRPKQNFVEMGLDIGAEIHFIPLDASCFIESETKVQYGGQIWSLTALTKQLLQSERPVRPAPYWTYEGRKLSSIYDETYNP